MAMVRLSGKVAWKCRGGCLTIRSGAPLGGVMQLKPFPHFVRDNAVSRWELLKTRFFWPDSDLLAEESPGSGYKLAHLRCERHVKDFSRAQRAYWDGFIERVCVPLAEDALELYAPWLGRKFGHHLQTAELMTVALTEFDSGNPTVNVGVHVHRHDPMWLCTMLLHVDDGGDERGNALFGLDAYDDEAFSALAALAPHAPVPGMTLQSECAFKPRRLFSFLETPVSYHGTRPAHEWKAPKGRRRMIRMHVRAPLELTPALYGVSDDEFRKLQYPNGTPDPRCAEWIARDMRCLFSSEPVELKPVKVSPPAWAS